MKTTIIPPFRVSPELRKQAEAVLDEGETFSDFLLDALNRNIEYRKARQAFHQSGKSEFRSGTLRQNARVA